MTIGPKGPLLFLPVRRPGGAPPVALPKASRPTAPKKAETDRVVLSPTGQAARIAAQRMDGIEAPGQDRVLVLKRQLEQGRYRIQADRVAGAMLAESLANAALLAGIDRLD